MVGQGSVPQQALAYFSTLTDGKVWQILFTLTNCKVLAYFGTLADGKVSTCFGTLTNRKVLACLGTLPDGKALQVSVP